MVTCHIVVFSNIFNEYLSFFCDSVFSIRHKLSFLFFFLEINKLKCLVYLLHTRFLLKKEYCQLKNNRIKKNDNFYIALKRTSFGESPKSLLSSYWDISKISPHFSPKITDRQGIIKVLNKTILISLKYCKKAERL